MESTNVAEVRAVVLREFIEQQDQSLNNLAVEVVNRLGPELFKFTRIDQVLFLVENFGRPISRAEVCTVTGLSSQDANRHLKLWADRGRIRVVGTREFVRANGARYPAPVYGPVEDNT